MNNNRLEFTKDFGSSGEYLYINAKTLHIPKDIKTLTSQTGVKKVYNMEVDKTPGWSFRKDTNNTLFADYTPDFQRTVGTKSVVVLDSKEHTISFSCVGVRYKIHTSLFFSFIYPQLSMDVMKAYLGLDSCHPFFTSVNSKSIEKVNEIRANEHIAGKIRRMFTHQLVVRDSGCYRDIFSLRHLPAFLWDGCVVHEQERERLNDNPRQSMNISGVDKSFRFKLYTPTDYSQTTLTPEYVLGIISRLLLFSELDIVPITSVGSGLYVVSLDEKIEHYYTQDRMLLEEILANTENPLTVFGKFNPEQTRLTADMKKHDSNIVEVYDPENVYSTIRDSGRTQVVRTAKHSSMSEQLVNPYLLSVLDSVDVSEKDNIGNNTPLTMLAESNNGDITVPLRDLKTGEVSRYSASLLPDFYVAEFNADLKKSVILVRHRGEVIYLPPNKATHQLVSPYSSMSYTRSTALYPENQDPKRTQMTGVAQKQSRSILRPQRALVSTGSDSIIANNDSPVKVYATVEDVFKQFWKEQEIPEQDLTGEKFIIEQSGTSMKHGVEYTLVNLNSDRMLIASFKIEFEKGQSKSVSRKRIHPSSKDYYVASDIIWSIPSFHSTIASIDGTDLLDYHSKGNDEYWNKGMGTGFNATIMFGFYKSLTVDDASVMSDKYVRDMGLHTPRTIVVRIPTKFFGSGGFASGGTKPKGFESNGLPKEGTIIRQGSPVFYYLQGGTQRCVYMKPSDMGEVLSVDLVSNKDGKKTKNEYTAIITLYNMVQVGLSDKFSGRHGNKTLCAKIIPYELMPYDPATGVAVDFILNPLSIITRNNLGQPAEMFAGISAQHDKTTKIDAPYTNKFYEYIKKSVGNEDLYEKHLVDGETGVLSETAFYVGPMYMLRLIQLAADKIKSVGDAEECDLDNAFGSPSGSDPHNRKGQSLGAYEIDLLYSLNARALLDEVQGIMSTDKIGREKVFAEIKNYTGDLATFSPSETGQSKMHNNIDVISRSLYMNIETSDEGSMLFSFASDDCNREFTKLTNSMIATHIRDKKRCDGFTYIEFQKNFRFINPIAYSKLGLTEVIVVFNLKDGEFKSLTEDMVDTILKGDAWFKLASDEKGNDIIYFTKETQSSEDGWGTRALDLIEFIENTPWDVFKSIQERVMGPNNVYLNNMKKSLDKLGGVKAIISRTVPVIPLKFRMIDETLRENSFFTDGYWNLYRQSEAESDFNEKHNTFLNMFGHFFLDAKSSGQDAKPIREFLFQKDSDGKLRNYMTKKRLLCSMRGNILPQNGYHPDEFGLPYAHAVNIFSPFVVGFMHQFNPAFKTWNDFDIINLTSVMRILDTRRLISLSKGLISSKQEIDRCVKEIVNIIEHKVGHYNRAPALQETSIRGARIRVHFNGDFMELNTLLTKDQNADFDGDQEPFFAVYSEPARAEVINLLLPSANVIRSNDNKLSLEINQDSLLGLYLLTEEQTSSGGTVYVYQDCKQLRQALLDRKIRKNTPVRIKGVVDLACNHVINHYSWGCAPSEKIITSASLSEVYKKLQASYQSSDIASIISDLLILGYDMINLFNVTLSIKDFQPILDLPDPEEVLLPKLQKLLDLRKLGLLPSNITSHVTALVDEYNSPIGKESFLPKGNNLLPIIKSGAKGNFSRLSSIFGVKGVAESNDGYFTTPIFSGYVRGISQLSNDTLSFAQRKNAYATVEGTKTPGALFRDSCFLLYDMFVKPENTKDLDHYIFYMQDGTVSPVFQKLINESNKESQDAFYDAIEVGSLTAKAKTPINDFRADGGISENCQIGTEWSKDVLVGMKAATAMSANTTQMTISRRHYEAGQDSSALSKYSALINSGKLFQGKHPLEPYKVVSIYAPFDGYVHVEEGIDSTVILLTTDEETYNIFLDLDHTLMREYTIMDGPVKQEQCLSYTKHFKNNPYEAIHPIHSTNFYKEGRSLAKVERIECPNQYQLQFARFAILHYLHDIHAATSDSIELSHFILYASKLFTLGTSFQGEVGYIGMHLEKGTPFYVEMFKKIKRVFHTAGPMTAYMYQHPFDAAKMSITSGERMDRSHLSKMMFSVPLSTTADSVYAKPSLRKIHSDGLTGTKKREIQVIESTSEPEADTNYDASESDSLVDLGLFDEEIDLFGDFATSNEFGVNTD